MTNELMSKNLKAKIMKGTENVIRYEKILVKKINKQQTQLTQTV